MKANGPFKTVFFISKARIAFTQLRKAFIKTLILLYFYLKCYIWSKVDTLSYVISEVFCQMILDQLFTNNMTSNNPNLNIKFSMFKIE